jgi:hypothetical protein
MSVHFDDECRDVQLFHQRKLDYIVNLLSITLHFSSRI